MTTENQKFIIFHKHYCNYPVKIIAASLEEANEVALDLEYLSIIKSGNLGIYAMEPNTDDAHVDLAKYLENNLGTTVDYRREDGTPQILWDFPAPSGITKENVRDIIAITNFRKYNIIDASEFEGEYLILFSTEMNFSLEGLVVEAFVCPDIHEAELKAMDLILETSKLHSFKLAGPFTQTEEFATLVSSLEYFQFYPGNDLFMSKVNGYDIYNYNESELAKLKLETNKILDSIAKETYRIEKI